MAGTPQGGKKRYFVMVETPQMAGQASTSHDPAPTPTPASRAPFVVVCGGVVLRVWDALRALFGAFLALADVFLVAREALGRRPLALAAKRGGRGRERES